MHEPIPGLRTRRKRSILRGLVALVVVEVTATPLLWFVAITVAPNRTADGHVVMPMGQAAFALFFGFLSACFAAFWWGRGRP